MTSPRTYGLYLGDLDRDSNKSHGIINYSVGLAVALSRNLDPGERLVVYANPEIAEELTGIDPQHTRIHLVARPKNSAHRLFLDAQSAWLARRHGVDLLHYPKGILPLGLPPRAWAPPLITTIHDDIPMQYADARITRSNFREQVQFKLIAWLFMRSLRRSDCVITVSAGSRDALLRRLHDGKRRARVSDIEVGGGASTLPDLEYVPRAERSAHVLHLASPHAHKGSAFNVESMRRYLDERAPDLRLVLVGRLPADVSVDDPRIEQHTAPVTNAEMATLMATARALLFVSKTEGYGLPPLEAWRYGTPSIYDSAPSLEELDQDVPAHLSEWSYDAFADALDTVLALSDDEVLRIRDAVTTSSDPNAVATRILRLYRAHVQS